MTTGITFHNTRECVDWPQVSLFMDGTDVVVVTNITNKRAREETPLSAIEEALDKMLGPFTWDHERDIAMRSTELTGRRTIMNGLASGWREIL